MQGQFAVGVTKQSLRLSSVYVLGQAVNSSQTTTKVRCSSQIKTINAIQSRHMFQLFNWLLTPDMNIGPTLLCF